MKNLFYFRLYAITVCMGLFLGGCGNWAIHNYPHPDSIVLESATPENAIIYFLRAPYDSTPIALASESKVLAKMAPETYVAIRLPPGSYKFFTKSSGLFSTNRDLTEPLELVLKPNDRVFYHMSGSEEKRIALTDLAKVAGGIVPVLGRQSVLVDRVWKECSEIDARGLISISRQVSPER